MASRLGIADFIRAFSALAVVMIHASGPLVAGSKLASTLNQLSRFAVPGFIVLSGFLLYYAEQKRTEINIKNFYFSRFKKVFIPYIVWSIFYSVVNTKSASFILEPFNFFNTLIFAKANFHLYFIIIVMQMYLVYPLFCVCLKNVEKLFLLGAFLITFYSQLQIYLHEQQIYIPKISFWIPGYMHIFTWLFYFVFGMALAKHAKKIDDWKPVSIFWPIAFFGGSFGILLMDNHYTQLPGLSIKPSIMLYTVGSLFLMMRLWWVLERFNSIRAFVRWIALQSTFIYFAHAIILDRVMKWVSSTTMNQWLNAPSKLFVFFVGTMGITCFFAYILSKVTFADFLGGYSLKRPNQKVR